MNERIRELAEQARKKPMGDSWCYTNPEEFEKKFAELIVRECVQVLDTCHVDIAEDADPEDNNTWVNATMNTTVNFCMGRVKQHFGVEQ